MSAGLRICLPGLLYSDSVRRASAAYRAAGISSMAITLVIVHATRMIPV